MRIRRFLLVAAMAAPLALATPAGAQDRTEVQASVKFTMRYRGDTQKYRLGQSKIVESELDATPMVPISLHAGPKDDPFNEVVLAGKGEQGRQKTSDDLVLSINVDIGTASVFYISNDGNCTVNIKKLTDDRIAGSFTCDAEYGDDPLTAKGTFKAR